MPQRRSWHVSLNHMTVLGPVRGLRRCSMKQLSLSQLSHDVLAMFSFTVPVATGSERVSQSCF